MSSVFGLNASPSSAMCLPRSSLPRNFFFSHLPAVVDAVAAGDWDAPAGVDVQAGNHAYRYIHYR